MIANKSYAYDLSVPEKLPEYMPNKEDFKILKGKNININKAPKPQKAPKSRLSLILTVILMFTMGIIISNRYNIISEKNLEVQRLKMEQSSINSELATTEVMVEQIIDKDKVESYAKQQLGMQKPDKNQVIYINSKYETNVESIAEENIFEKIYNGIKNLIK